MRSRDRFDMLVLDIDGVLLDTAPSFTAAVLETGRRCAVAPGLADTWTGADVERLRLAGGFNNDWDSAAALALLGPASGPGVQWAETCREIKQRGGGPRAVESMTGAGAWGSVRTAVLPVFQRIYAGPRSMEIYGIPPEELEGLYERERPLANPEEIFRTGLPVGFFTGRTREEAVLAMERLGLEVDGGRLVCDTEPRFRKPLPDGLLAIASEARSERPLFVGDTVDDMGSAISARASGLDVAFAGIAELGSERERRLREGGAVAVRPSLSHILRDCFGGRGGSA